MDEIAVFHLHGVYLFKRFFDDGSIFNDLQRFYDGDEYRFEVPDETGLDAVRETLQEYGYAVRVVEDAAPYTVVKKRDEPYSDILRDAVDHSVQGDYNVFVMRSEAKAEQAEMHGATPISETELRVPS